MRNSPSLLVGYVYIAFLLECFAGEHPHTPLTWPPPFLLRRLAVYLSRLISFDSQSEALAKSSHTRRGPLRDLQGYCVSGLDQKSPKIRGRNPEDGGEKQWCGYACVCVKEKRWGVCVCGGVGVMSGRWQICEFFPCAHKAKEVVVWWSHLQNTYSLYPTLLPPSWGDQRADYYTGGYSAVAPPPYLLPLTQTQPSTTLNRSSHFCWDHLKTYFAVVQT